MKWKIKDWWKRRKYWQKGGIIGFIVGILIPVIWFIAPMIFEGYIALILGSGYILSHYLYSLFVGGCSEFSCLPALLFVPFSYAFIGIIIGILIQLIIKLFK